MVTWRLGHNGGPPIDDQEFAWGTAPIDVYFSWKRAHDEVWKSVSYHTMMRRLKNAEAIGLSYEEYMLELLFNGRHLTADDVLRIEQIKAARKSRG